MKYQWIVFDADETLFHFDAFAGLKQLFSNYNIVFEKSDFDEFQSVNKPLWIDYQNGTISAKELQVKRFTLWGDKLDVDPALLNQQFIAAMADICQCLPGARKLLELLHGKAKLAIITNGFTALQQVRLARTDLTHFFEHVIISEQVGVAKPNIAIFDHALQLFGSPEKSTVLMVGDTLSSDILGGKNAGLDTCWINHEGDKVEDTVGATYQVGCLTGLYNLIKSFETESV
ncbi:pyrimidine 5'-nucleotidase [Pseudoalteromonas sp.]|uniref:pyrimidine 5'-nucleotidase n=1 Tax=Pseudoalteromonas sp. TaxID=53249 RepID=UPI0035657429